MNRSEVYWFLADSGMRTYRVTVNKRTYKKLFKADRYQASLRINNTWIINVDHIYICNDEIVIRDKFSLMQINIPYRDIEDMEYSVIEEEDL